MQDDIALPSGRAATALCTAEFEPAQEWIPVDPIRLEGSVCATLQGGYVAQPRLTR
jgi:hypothetical protein